MMNRCRILWSVCFVSVDVMVVFQIMTQTGASGMKPG
jgi:hypothetical protein